MLDNQAHYNLATTMMNNYNCCILKTLPHRLCSNNITDVAQEVMLHRQQIFPTNQLIHAWLTGKHKLYVALGLMLHSDFTLVTINVKPLYNITCVYQLPMHQLLLII